MNLQSNDFELFGVSEHFAQDRALLEARWKELQREAHPDKFAAQGAAAQRIAMQWSVRINEAYQRLKDPIQRAAYLCELRGASIDAQRNTAMPADFLMQQMEWREALDEADTEDDMDLISDQSASMLREMLLKVERQLDVEQLAPLAAQTVRAMMFIEKFQADIERRYELLGQ
jgi:molecular chaperone HscB